MAISRMGTLLDRACIDLSVGLDEMLKAIQNTALDCSNTMHALIFLSPHMLEGGSHNSEWHCERVKVVL